jgi:DNA-binding transcriptional ArsR family regulator
MSVTIDITGLPHERLLFAPSPLAELTAMLHVLAEPSHHPSLHGWATGTVAALKPELADRLLEAEFLWRSSRADFLVPAHPAATLAEELDAVDRIDDELYVAAALVTTCGSSRITFRPRSPLLDAATRERARELAQARGPRQAAFADRLLADPPAVRAIVRRLLEDCAESFFTDAWARVLPQLAADARLKADLLARHGLSEALAAVSPAASYDRERGRISVDKLQDNATSGAGDGVTFIPTAFGRPHLVVVHSQAWRPVVQYPVAEPAVPRPVTLDQLQQRLEALAHPARIRLARTLARGEHTTGELAAAWQLTAPEVSRHLTVLKKAGLVTTRRRGRYVLHHLDLGASARLGTDFLEALLR